MRTAYALLGILFLLIMAGGVYAFNHGFTPAPNAASIINSAIIPMASSTLTLTSSAFANNGRIPSKYTCDGDRTVSPPLSISGVPGGTKTLALIMDDPDVPKALKPSGVFDHWVLFNIPPTTKEIPESGSVGTPGANGAGSNAYTGPCPPSQYEPSEHRYIFVLYALDAELALRAGASKADVLRAIEGHVLGRAELIGRYKRQ